MNWKKYRKLKGCSFKILNYHHKLSVWLWSLLQKTTSLILMVVTFLLMDVSSFDNLSQKSPVFTLCTYYFLLLLTNQNILFSELPPLFYEKLKTKLHMPMSNASLMVVTIPMILLLHIITKFIYEPSLMALIIIIWHIEPLLCCFLFRRFSSLFDGSVSDISLIQSLWIDSLLVFQWRRLVSQSPPSVSWI